MEHNFFCCLSRLYMRSRIRSQILYQGISSLHSPAINTDPYGTLEGTFGQISIIQPPSAPRFRASISRYLNLFSPVVQINYRIYVNSPFMEHITIYVLTTGLRPPTRADEQVQPAQLGEVSGRITRYVDQSGNKIERE